MKIVHVNKDDCTSCSLCADTLPNYFRMDSSDLAESHNTGTNTNNAQVPDSDESKVQEAINDCPGECIHWK